MAYVMSIIFCLMFDVGCNANFSVRIGGNPNFRAFRYQHVGIPNTKLWCWGSIKPTRGPNVNGFASQWNIGFTKTTKVHLEFHSLITLSH